jgi:hypothetical protein
VQHHPDALGLVEADLDEVIPGAKRADGSKCIPAEVLSSLSMRSDRKNQSWVGGD